VTGCFGRISFRRWGTLLACLGNNLGLANLNVMPFINFIEQFRVRRLALVLDDSSEDLRAVMVVPAAGATSELVNEMILKARGILFVAVSSERVDELQLAEMTRSGTVSRFAAPREHESKRFVSVEARHGVSSGISAADRATTLNMLGSSAVDPRLIVSPGHLFPVEALAGGVLVRSSLPEAAVDCVRALGEVSNVAGYMDCLNENGEVCGAEEISRLSDVYGIPQIRMSEIVRYRLSTESLVTKVAEANLPTELAGIVRIYSFRTQIHAGDHIALVKGDVTTRDAVLTRVQVESTFSDIFGSEPHSTRNQVRQALTLIGARERGVLVYLSRIRRGGVLDDVNSLSSFEEKGLATAQKDTVTMRQYGIGAQILRHLGVSRLELLSSRSGKREGLYDFGLDIVKTIPLF
jgi:3,4-dihydroxy 2-butanone 4-phosphate synthase/GTP cyclohydrolase II